MVRVLGSAANAGGARRKRSNTRLPGEICIRPRRKGIRPRPLAVKIMSAITGMTSGAAVKSDQYLGLRQDWGAECGGPQRELLLPDRVCRDILRRIARRSQSGLGFVSKTAPGWGLKILFWPPAEPIEQRGKNSLKGRLKPCNHHFDC